MLSSGQPAPPFGGSAASAGQSWVRLGAFVVLAVSAMLVVTALSRSIAPPSPAAFDQYPLNFLKEVRPKFVLLGNSMVGTRFDDATLRRLLRPHSVAVLGLSGSTSAVWYLALKNIVIASGQRPRVIHFFRERELTDLHVYSPRQRYRIERVSVGTEAFVDQKLAPPFSEPVARFEWYRERAVPVERLRDKTDPLVANVADWSSRLLSQKADPSARKRAINELFALANLRVEEAFGEPPASLQARAFKDVVEPSFLPSECELANENHIPLTFVRVRTRAAALGEPQTAAERQYDADLERYVRGCGAEFYDMRDATWESISLYGSGDHIAGKFKRLYTELFVQHMGQIFH